MSLNRKDVRELFKPPFAYDIHSQSVMDSENNLVVDIRGYGYLSNVTDNDTVCGAQDKLGEEIAELLNGNYHCDCCSIG